MQKSQRLIQLIMRINAKKSFTVQELADEFGLSTRTITRDLVELSELGVPVYSVQGRGGGYRLLQERLLPPISFSESEAIAMFFACQSLEHYSSSPFGEGADSALHKFYHYLPADVREGVDRLKDKVSIYSPYRPMSGEVLQLLLKAVMHPSVLTIEYRSSDGLAARDIQPFGLYASSGYWYCPAYCFTRQDVRLFRADRIQSAIPNDGIQPREDIDQMTLANKPSKTHLEQMVLQLEVTNKGIWQLASDTRFAPHLTAREDGSGSVRLPIAAEDLAFFIDRIWQLGPEVWLTSPPEAVAAMRQRMKAVQERYV
ncbi:helix-turn-helix transcriptional regulator [Paenibacillus sp. GCM10023252]|uniref:helix-turn-helix transcriptional regulator n=1 Tax=Paenibacillus sp. GCM10023252 TaxID=3252649 RepID=UPI003618A4D9